MVAAGLRVIRGPGWSHGDADDGEGHVGTVVDASDNGTATVTWDSGQQVIVKPGSRDLRVLDNAPVGKVVIYIERERSIYIFLFFVSFCFFFLF